MTAIIDRYELRRQNYELDDDQRSVRDVFADFFSNESPTGVARAAEPIGHDAQLWAKLVDMGVTSMSLPAALGGDEATLVDLQLIAEEVGRNVAPVPFVSHTVATRLLCAAGADRAVLDAAIAGAPVAIALEPVRDQSAVLVPDAAIARHVIALDVAAGDLVLLRFDQPAEHVRNQGSTPLGWLRPGAAAARAVLASGDAAYALHETAVHEWKLLTAAALVGITEASLHLAVEFAKTRETLGVPIGALQGVAFPLADVAIGVTGARNLAWRAGWMHEHEPQADPVLTSKAYAYAAQVATHGATTSAHMQGGLGFTHEADASLYFLRSKGWSVLGGDPIRDLITVGAAVLDAAATQI